MTETISIQERPLTIDQASEFLNFKKSYLYKLVCSGKVPCYRPGGKRVFFKLSDLKEYVYRHRQSADYEIKEEAERIING
ncbi:helix-turn-helix transcriptional regulator [Treponema primitia]|uniref:helix-turn-helix transcriptional regulator n=1 Tax=Treponema primitia TaxID=88058 RepID=UPI000255584D|nr:helix-turn-helix domain-containing protein [Treponema primitia]